MVTNSSPCSILKLRRRLFVLGVAAALPMVRAAPPVDVFEPALKQWLGSPPAGVAAAQIDADGVTFFAAGTFDPADARPITADTKFEIGSVTKVFTALLLADTMQAGKVKLDDTVGAPFAASAVTFQQLATHTAGVPRMEVYNSCSPSLSRKAMRSADTVLPAGNWMRRRRQVPCARSSPAFSNCRSAAPTVLLLIPSSAASWCFPGIVPFQRPRRISNRRCPAT